MSSNTMRRLTAGSIAVASIIALAACSGTSSSSSSSGTGNATIDLWTHNGGNDAELAEPKRIATSGRQAGIRILLHDPAAALRDGHRLIALFQRLSSTIQIRTPVEDVDRQCASAWLLNDTGGYLFLPDASRPQGRVALGDRAAQAPLQRQFDEVWERSARASELQALDL